MNTPFYKTIPSLHKIKNDNFFNLYKRIMNNI